MDKSVCECKTIEINSLTNRRASPCDIMNLNIGGSELVKSGGVEGIKEKKKSNWKKGKH